jgi:hypothetical protein
MPGKLMNLVLGLIGAAVGAVLGYFAFAWILYYHFYGLILPGAFMGLGAGLLGRRPSRLRGIVVGLAAVPFSLFCHWSQVKFVNDPSLKFFVAHLGDLGPVTWGMTVLGAIFAYWWGGDAFGPLEARPGPPPVRKASEPVAE